MAIRTRSRWRPQQDGQFARQLGWKKGPSGKRIQPKFRLGTDLKEAKRRECMLTDLWEHIEQRSDAGAAVWPAEALDIAKQIARDGRGTIERQEGEYCKDYAYRGIFSSAKAIGRFSCPLSRACAAE